jgi:hypothetical protein
VNVPDLVAAKGQVVDRGAVLPQRRGGDVPLGVVGGLGFGAVPAEMDDPRLLPGGVGGRVEEGSGADVRHREQSGSRELAKRAEADIGRGFTRIDTDRGLPLRALRALREMNCGLKIEDCGWTSVVDVPCSIFDVQIAPDPNP